MKAFGNLFAALMCVVLMSAAAWGQLLTEDFNYAGGTALLGQGGWTITGAVVTNPFTVGNSGLSYTGYAGSSIGNSIPLVSSGQDAYLGFTSQNSGSVYASLLANVSTAQSGDYFFHLGQTAGTTSAFFARLYVRFANNGNLTFGIAKSSAVAGSPTYSDSIYTLNTTYLIVVKYTFNTGTTTDDQVSIFVFSDPTLPGSEPGTATVGPITTSQTDATSLAEINLRQGSTLLAANVVVDGIRVGTSWIVAPLPVQLVSFSAAANRLAAELHWSTATEKNNYGFDVERRAMSNQLSANSSEPVASSWSKVGFVAGAGTSSLSHEYSYYDGNLAPGRYAYRLKQVDNDGSFSYSGAAELEIGLGAKEFKMESNYPNPFNPSTTIQFTLAEDSKASLKVYNMLGQEAATLFDGEAQAGRIQQVKFDASRLPSGLYVAKLEAGKQQMIRKMMLVK